MGDTRVTVTGPFFDGRDHAALDALCEEIAYEVGAEGRDIVRLNSDTSFKTQTPHYVLQLRNTDTGQFTREVNDSGVIYGPWLEGVGSRNFPRTRFKGYSMFRRAAQYLNAGAAHVIAERVASIFVRRM